MVLAFINQPVNYANQIQRFHYSQRCGDNRPAGGVASNNGLLWQGCPKRPRPMPLCPGSGPRLRPPSPTNSRRPSRTFSAYTPGSTWRSTSWRTRRESSWEIQGTIRIIFMKKTTLIFLQVYTKSYHEFKKTVFPCLGKGSFSMPTRDLTTWPLQTWRTSNPRPGPAPAPVELPQNARRHLLSPGPSATSTPTPVMIRSPKVSVRHHKYSLGFFFGI